MAYRLIYTKTASGDIQKLDTVAKRKIGKKLKDYSQSPLTYAKKLTDPKIGTYRWRIGNYRIVFDIEGNNLVILRAGHRKEIYR
jgi:mRNA interferase RelE/StbE